MAKVKTTVKTSKKAAKEEVKVKKSTKKVAGKVAKPTKKEGKVKRTAKAKPEKVIIPIKEKLNNSQFIQHLVDKTEMDKKAVKLLVETISDTILGCVHPKGVGEFTFPKLFKVVTKKIPAKKARKGISPFSGEEVIFKAKPATVRVKVRPMKTLKEAAV